MTSMSNTISSVFFPRKGLNSKKNDDFITT